MSKIKLVPCPNITKRELMTALMDGRRFTVNANDKGAYNEDRPIHWDDNHGNNPVRDGRIAWNFRGFKYLHELVEQKWWEDPEMVGKPVKVRDLERDEWALVYFHGYQKHDAYKFCCDAAAWKYAEPLTTADLYQGKV